MATKIKGPKKVYALGLGRTVVLLIKIMCEKERDLSDKSQHISDVLVL